MSNRKTKIHVFHCVNSYEQAEVLRTVDRQIVDLSLISMPCSGKLDILYLTKALETGADGVAVMMCRDGECRYLEGNKRAKKRVGAVEELLEETGLGKGRIAVIQLVEGGTPQAAAELHEFCGKIAGITAQVSAK